MKNIFAFLLPVLVLVAVNSCKSQEKNSEVIQKIDKLDEYSSQNLYLAARIVKDTNTGEVKVLTIENDVIEKSGNPLPLPPNASAKDSFRCEILGKTGEVLFSSEQKTNFAYGDDKNEAIVKFILPLPEGADYATISYKRSSGDWEQLVKEAIK